MACVVTQDGEELMTDLLDGSSPGLPAYGAWGTGAGTADKADETLFSEAAETRVAVTRSQPLADKLRMVWLMTAIGGQTITNAGVFTLITGGILFEHYDHTGVVLNPGDQIEYTLECQVQ